jgi:hypothetical protein
MVWLTEFWWILPAKSLAAWSASEQGLALDILEEVDGKVAILNILFIVDIIHFCIYRASSGTVPTFQKRSPLLPLL